MDNVVWGNVESFKSLRNTAAVDGIVCTRAKVEECFECPVLSDVAHVTDPNALCTVCYRIAVWFWNPQGIAVTLEKELPSVHLGVGEV